MKLLDIFHKLLAVFFFISGFVGIILYTAPTYDKFKVGDCIARNSVNYIEDKPNDSFKFKIVEVSKFSYTLITQDNVRLMERKQVTEKIFKKVNCTW